MSGLIGAAGSRSGILGRIGIEEGSFELGLSGAAGVGPYGFDSGQRTAYYTKIGPVVHISWEVGLSSIGSISGNAEMTGLPYTASRIGFFFLAYGDGIDGATRGGYINGTTMYWTDNHAQSMAQWQAQSPTKFKVGGSYFTAS